MPKRCPTCNYVNPDEAVRCVACGSPLGQTCPRCGALNPPGTRRCATCGERLSKEEVFAQLFQEKPPQSIRGRYIIESTLSRGRVSAFYRVRDAQSNRRPLILQEISEIALLTGAEKGRARASFEADVRRWSELEHPALPKILDAFFSREKHYVVMDVGPAFGLEQLMRSSSFPLDEDRVVNWGAQLGELLGYLHRLDPPVVLGEIRPNHIMITQEGLVQLVELGLAEPFGPQREDELGLGGRSPYMAPEARAGSLTPAADIYSLGMLLYAVMTRRLLSPQSRRPAALRDGIPGASRHFQGVILRATRRSPEERFPTAIDFREALWGDDPIVLQPLPATRRRSKAEPAQAPSAPAARTPERQPAPPKPAEAPQLLVRPRRLEVQLTSLDQKQSTSLAIYNTGTADMDVRIFGQVGWISVGRSSAHLGPKQAVKVPITILGSRLTREGASDPQAILVDSDGGRTWIAVEATISTVPVLALPQETIDLGEVQGTRQVTGHVFISNAGGGLLSGSVRSHVDWLQVPHPEFHCSPQQSVKVAVLLDPRRLPPGQRNEPSALVVDSEAGQARVAVRVRRVQPELAVGPDMLDFGALLVGEQGQSTLTIANEGDGQLDYALRSRAPWIQVSPRPGRCQAGERVETTVVVDTERLSEGLTELDQALLVQSNAGDFHVGARVQVLAPKLEVDASWLDLGEVLPDAPLEQIIRLRNGGSAPLRGGVTTSIPWLSVSPAEFEVQPGEAQEIATSIDLATFARGQVVQIPNALRISTNGGDLDLALHMVVLRPVLEVIPPSLDFGVADRVNPVEQKLTIANPDTGTLEWRIHTDALWVEILPSEGACPAGSESTIRVVAYGLALPSEETSAQGMLYIQSNGGRAQVPMTINMASPVLDVDVTRVDLGVSLNYAPTEGSFIVFNHGLGPLRGSVEVRSERVSVEPDSFVCDTGTSQMIQVRANTENLPAGLFEEDEAIHIESNGGEMDLDIYADVVLTAEVEASLSPLSVAEESDVARGRLTLENTGGETAKVTITPSSERLEITRHSCTIKPGKSLRLQVTLRLDQEEELEPPFLDIDAGKQRLRVPVELEPPLST